MPPLLRRLGAGDDPAARRACILRVYTRKWRISCYLQPEMEIPAFRLNTVLVGVETLTPRSRGSISGCRRRGQML
jgi:hypothetical protein